MGTGVQGRETVRALAALRRLRAVRVTDANPDAAHDVVRVAEEEFGVLATVEPGVDAVVRKADVLVLATWSRTPLLHLRHVRPGLHATSLEADEPGVMQVSDAVRATGLLVVDDRELARPVVGEADSTLGEVLRGEHAGRTSDDDVTLYAPAGLPSQDAVAACHVYERACAAGLGARVDLR